MQAKFNTPGPFSIPFCLAQQALSGQHGVVKSHAPHPPHTLLPFSLTCVGRSRLEYRLLVCAAWVLKWLSLYSWAQAAWAWSAYSLLPPGQTSSQTKPMPIIIASRCTRLTRPLTAKPAGCSSGRSLLPIYPLYSGLQGTLLSCPVTLWHLTSPHSPIGCLQEPER